MLAEVMDGVGAAELLDEGSTPATPAPMKKSSDIWRRVRQTLRSPAIAAATLYLIILAFAAIFGPLILPHDPNQQDLSNVFQGPSASHWFGTDDLGRDTLSRLIQGARISLLASVQVVVTVLIFGLLLGLPAGYFRGWFDSIVMRVVDILLSLPPLVLALAVAGILGPGLTNLMLALTISYLPVFVRLVRGEVLRIRNETYIQASRGMGTRAGRILVERVLHNVLSPLLVEATLTLGKVILAEASLSFLGLGVSVPNASWGSMLQKAYGFIYTQPWGMVPAGAAIALTTLAFNLVGDSARDVFLGADIHGKSGPLGVTTVAPRSVDDRAEGERERDTVLEVTELTTGVRTSRPVDLVDGVNLMVRPGKVLGLVGESGSGKSITAMSIGRLLLSPPIEITDGVVRLDGADILAMDRKEFRRARAAGMGFVFQDPMSSLNPSFTIGWQITRALASTESLSTSEAHARAVSLLTEVGISDPEARLRAYPHELSGGMRQRVMIAIALSREPQLLLADEPTTALDVTVQAQILDLLRERAKAHNASMLFVTHDLGVVRELCDDVAVMYAGHIVEYGPVREIFQNPQHPYTRLLLEAHPLNGEPGERLVTIPGSVPEPGRRPQGCRFAERCPLAQDECRDPGPTMVVLDEISGHRARCVFAGSIEERL